MMASTRMNRLRLIFNIDKRIPNHSSESKNFKEMIQGMGNMNSVKSTSFEKLDLYYL